MPPNFSKHGDHYIYGTMKWADHQNRRHFIYIHNKVITVVSVKEIPVLQKAHCHSFTAWHVTVGEHYCICMSCIPTSKLSKATNSRKCY